MIVTIDGPAGAGKSSVARRLADRLGFRYLDTGSMYRAVTLAAIERGIDLTNAQAVVRLIRQIAIDLDGHRVLVDGRDVTDRIRTVEVTRRSRYVADNPAARELLVDRQRRLAAGADVVAEGRDQGTVVFPRAECKIFLTARAETRARRRCRDRLAAGEKVHLDEVLAEQQQRDQRDRSRPVGPLVPAVDAIHVATDQLTLDQVVDRLETVVRSRLGKPQQGAG